MTNIPIRIIFVVLDRDANTCQYCGKIGIRIKRYGKPCVIENPNNIDLKKECFNYNGLDVIPFEIDHVIPRGYGGKSDESNLVLSCHECNRKKGFRLLGVSYGRSTTLV
jgi:hypothetical protein